jgi:hypothetical protein
MTVSNDWVPKEGLTLKGIPFKIDPTVPEGTIRMVPPTISEVRIVDAQTGGEKGSKLPRFDLIPPEATWALAEHYGKGCAKYSDRNWERGYKWGLSVAAMQRHLHQWMMGESYDSETKSHHLIAVIWHAIALFVFEQRGLGTDDVRVYSSREVQP